MTKPFHVIALAEGKTEQIFIDSLVAPYLAARGVYIRATQAKKAGQAGGKIQFGRMQNDIGGFLKQNPAFVVTTFVDYYGLDEWPCLEKTGTCKTPEAIATLLNTAAQEHINQRFSAYQPHRRYIPYMAVHEFEALLFSDPVLLATHLGIKTAHVEAVLKEFSDQPEAINNHRETSPSHRIIAWQPLFRGSKTRLGIKIAHEIGLERMRTACPLFNQWLCALENLSSPVGAF